MSILDFFRKPQASPVPLEEVEGRPKSIFEKLADLMPKTSKTWEFTNPNMATPTPMPTPTPTATPRVYPQDLTQPPADYQPYTPKTKLEDVPRDVNQLNEIIKSGLAKRNNPPIATASADFAEAGSKLPENMNPLLPVIMSIIETGGGLHMPDESSYNTFNLLSPSRGGWARYNDFRSSLFGNKPEETVNFYDQMVEGSPYEPFRQSGDLSDLFRTYTPESDPSNPRNYELIDRYNMILDSLMGEIAP